MHLSTARNERSSGSNPALHQTNEYRLQFRGNARGVEKAMEFSAPNIVQAMQYVIGDPARRSVEIWENGEFICTVSRDQISSVAACGTKVDMELPRG